MGSRICKMDATDSEPWKFMGFNKKHIDDSWTRLFVWVHNLDKASHKIRVEFPKERSDLLRIFINDDEISTKVPGSVVVSECFPEVTFGRKGKITVMLRTLESKDWKNWSPSRVRKQEQLQPVAIDQPLHLTIEDYQ